MTIIKFNLKFKQNPKSVSLPYTDMQISVCFETKKIWHFTSSLDIGEKKKTFGFLTNHFIHGINSGWQ